MLGGGGGRGQQSFRFGEMIGGWVDANLGPMYQSASVGLLLKIIYQHVSASDVMRWWSLIDLPFIGKLISATVSFPSAGGTLT